MIGSGGRFERGDIVDESGESGKPRSGTDEATERHEGPQASGGPAADATRPERERSEDSTGPTPTEPGADAETPRPASESEPASAASGEPASTSGPSGEPASTSGPSDEPASISRPSGEPADTSPPVAGTEPTTATSDESASSPRPSDESASSPRPLDKPASSPRPADEPQVGRAPTDDARPDAAAAREAGAEDAVRTRAESGSGKGRSPRREKGPGGGLLMGRPFGVPVYVAPSWFLVAALITWVFGGQLDRVLPELGALRYLVSLFFAVAFYASVLVHELAHTVAALRFGLPVRRIQLQFFGGVSEIEKESETPGREFVLAFVGPLLSLVLSGVFYLAMQTVDPGTVPGVLLGGLMISNLIVAAFNLLPGLPLDGGRMLRAVVWKITGRPMSGTIAAAWVGRALAVAVLIGLPLLTQSGAIGGAPADIGGMDTVTDALLAAILAAIIWTGAGNSLRMARLREHLPDLRARALTRRAVPVETSTPLSEALRRANDAGARALVVVDADGQPLSLVRETAIVGVPEHRRPWVAVSGLAQDLTDGMRVSAELAGEDLLDALRANPATEYLVVEDSGEIYGVLSAADVERAFVKAMARPA
ncbi:site-2 protease family protein [Streptomyces sp. NPDC087263]|uniref:site-2 protease family protein n=1 Tax=Streptomyces sp. NPDC087263 TaxID=3365773 RepID=UPI00381A75AC